MFLISDRSVEVCIVHIYVTADISEKVTEVNHNHNYILCDSGLR